MGFQPTGYREIFTTAVGEAPKTADDDGPTDMQEPADGKREVEMHCVYPGDEEPENRDGIISPMSEMVVKYSEPEPHPEPETKPDTEVGS
jgi:hypothetical protein